MQIQDHPQFAISHESLHAHGRCRSAVAACMDSALPTLLARFYEDLKLLEWLIMEKSLDRG